MIEIGFYLLTFIMLFSPIVLLNKSDEPNKHKRSYLLTIIGWIIYISYLSNNHWLDDFSFPPRMPLLVVIPAIVFIVLFTSKNWVKEAINKVNDHHIIYLQSFRIFVELLIYGAFLNGLFPERSTFKGLNFDILVGISALLMGALVQYGYIKSKGILIWNIASLIILGITVFSFISAYYFLNFGNGENFGFVRLPYIFLASVLLPMAIFYHVVSIRKQLMKSTFS